MESEDFLNKNRGNIWWSEMEFIILQQINGKYEKMHKYTWLVAHRRVSPMALIV